MSLITQNLQKGTKGKGICMKLDISKAFDKLNWNFLFKVLDFSGFSKDCLPLSMNVYALLKALSSSAKSLLVTSKLEVGLGSEIPSPFTFSY